MTIASRRAGGLCLLAALALSAGGCGRTLGGTASPAAPPGTPEALARDAETLSALAEAQATALAAEMDEVEALLDGGGR
ncbi:MAG: hypothetical protein ACFBWO_18035 [Paracoccaceae bacterium]